MIRKIHTPCSLLQVCSEPSANAAPFRRSVDAYEDEICFPDTFFYINREEKVAAPSFTDDIIEAGLINRKAKIGAIPGIYSGFVEVHNGDLDIGTFKSDDSTRRTTL